MANEPKPKVELIYDRDCPNVDAAREQLQRALIQMNIAPGWREWERNDKEAPDYALSYGSPTILVDGNDVAGENPGDGTAHCRVYESSESANSGIPSVKQIVSAISYRYNNNQDSTD